MEQALKIEISGTALNGKDIEVFERRVHQRIIANAPAAKNESYNFARLNWRFVWTAEKFDINKVDSLDKYIRRLINDFLDKWTYGINIDYIESGGV